MSGAAIAIAGIALSAGLWLTGVRMFLAAQAQAIDNMPDSWRGRAPEDYEALRSLRLGDLDRYRLLALLAATVGFFWLLTAAGVSAGVQAGFAAVASVYWTHAGLADGKRRMETYRAAHGLDPVPRHRQLTSRYRGSLLMACLGFAGVGFFVAQGIAG
jgi:hypothetical protein